MSKRPIPEDFAEHALEPNAVLVKRYGVGHTLLSSWRSEIGMRKRKGRRKKHDDDYESEIEICLNCKRKNCIGYCSTVRNAK